MMQNHTNALTHRFNGHIPGESAFTNWHFDLNWGQFILSCRHRCVIIIILSPHFPHKKIFSWEAKLDIIQPSLPGTSHLPTCVHNEKLDMKYKPYWWNNIVSSLSNFCWWHKIPLEYQIPVKTCNIHQSVDLLQRSNSKKPILCSINWILISSHTEHVVAQSICILCFIIIIIIIIIVLDMSIFCCYRRKVIAFYVLLRWENCMSGWENPSSAVRWLAGRSA